jgi:hypothetical protein
MRQHYPAWTFDRDHKIFLQHGIDIARTDAGSGCPVKQVVGREMRIGWRLTLAPCTIRLRGRESSTSASAPMSPFMPPDSTPLHSAFAQQNPPPLRAAQQR